ncbi:hypothetical protein ACNPM4_10295 [Microbacterium sp. AGC62]
MSGRTTVMIRDHDVVVTPRGFDRIWCVRRRVVFPIGSIRDVRVEDAPYRVPTGWRGPGLDFAAKLCGTFHPNGERHFWNYSGKGDALEIVLDKGQHFQKLYLSVENADVMRDQLLTLRSQR